MSGRTFTLLDTLGEVVSVLHVRSAEQLALNAPPGTSAVEGRPPAPDAYRQGGAWVLRPERPSAQHTWNAQTKGWEDARTVLQARAQKRQELAADWKAAMAAGVTLGVKLVPTTRAAWVDYLTLRLMAQEAGWVDTPVQLADGSFELLTLAKAQALWTELKTLRRTQTARLRALSEAVGTAASVAAVDAINWDMELPT